MPKIIYNDISFDSPEELSFFHWCNELFENGRLKEFKRCEKKDSFELIGKQHYAVNGTKKFLFHDVKYCPDFILKGCLVRDIYEKPIHTNIIYVDIKPSFSKHGDSKQFSIIRKLMMSVFDIYVHKIIVNELFQKTFVPELCRYTKVKKDIQKKYLKTPTIKQYLKDK